MSFSKIGRVFIAGVGFFGVLFGFWWIPAVCMLLLCLRFRAWEACVMGLLIDFLWLPSGSVFTYAPLFTILGLVLVWIFEPMRSQFLVSD